MKPTVSCAKQESPFCSPSKKNESPTQYMQIPQHSPNLQVKEPYHPNNISINAINPNQQQNPVISTYGALRTTGGGEESGRLFKNDFVPMPAMVQVSKNISAILELSTILTSLLQGKNYSFTYSLNNPRPKAVRKIGGGAMVSGGGASNSPGPRTGTAAAVAPRPQTGLRPALPINVVEGGGGGSSSNAPKLSIVDFSTLANRSPKKRPKGSGRLRVKGRQQHFKPNQQRKDAAL